MIKFSSIIDWFGGIVELPLTLTENSQFKLIRVSGVIVYGALFFPSGLLFVVVAGILAIPAMIQDC